ncbi:hypothetical protein DRI50_08980 [candidate division KSB1 bacterium]|nr:MAG: hypothetical protein DRI50_08980 [candidate division KSB1 bacterium]
MRGWVFKRKITTYLIKFLIITKNRSLIFWRTFRFYKCAHFFFLSRTNNEQGAIKFEKHRKRCYV